MINNLQCANDAILITNKLKDLQELYVTSSDFGFEFNVMKIK